jgi:hypothetical protein
MIHGRMFNRDLAAHKAFDAAAFTRVPTRTPAG